MSDPKSLLKQTPICRCERQAVYIIGASVDSLEWCCAECAQRRIRLAEDLVDGLGEELQEAADRGASQEEVVRLLREHMRAARDRHGTGTGWFSSVTKGPKR